VRLQVFLECSGFLAIAECDGRFDLPGAGGGGRRDSAGVVGGRAVGEIFCQASVVSIGDRQTGQDVDVPIMPLLRTKDRRPVHPTKARMTLRFHFGVWVNATELHSSFLFLPGHRQRVVHGGAGLASAGQRCRLLRQRGAVRRKAAPGACAFFR